MNYGCCCECGADIPQSRPKRVLFKALQLPLFVIDGGIKRIRERQRVPTLLAEVRPPELPGLRGRGPCIAERFHDLVGEAPLSGRQTRRIVPAQSSADVVMHPRLRASDLVGAPVQLPYLLEQRLEHLVIDRQEEATLLAAEESLDEPVAEVDAAGGRFFGRNLQRTGPPAAVRKTLPHSRGACPLESPRTKARTVR